MNRLFEAGIEIHAQVVLCPEINDGEVLRRTIDDLAVMHPRVKSVAIVPLGLTRYNKDERLTPVTEEFCQRTIRQISPLQRELRQRLGTTFAFLGDEIYLRAGRAVPSRKHYGEYPQIEDGIGMVRSFQNDLSLLMRSLERKSPAQKYLRELNGTVMTGTLFAPELKKALDRLNHSFGTRFHVVAVENNYFGGDVSVAGLLTGGDFIKAANKTRGNFVIIPDAAIKSDEDIMLDGMTLNELRNKFQQHVVPMDVEKLSRMIKNADVSL